MSLRLIASALFLALLATTGNASTPPKDNPNTVASLGLRILKCSNGATQSNAQVVFTVYRNEQSIATYTAYTNPSGEVVQQMAVTCNDRIHVKITPFMSGTYFQRDYNYKGDCDGSYDEWVAVDVIDPNHPVNPCTDVKGDGNPIDWIVYLPIL